MVWTNGPRRVHHGTIDAHVAAIRSSIDPSAGRGAADFGQGFYVTTDAHQAEQWANQKVRSIPSFAPRAAVISFDLDLDHIAAFGDHLAFVLADAAFYDFVQFNRFGSKRHGRSTHAYDVVYGPVAAYPQTLTIAGCDQICFVAAGNSVMQAIKALTFAGDSYGAPYF